MKPVVMICPEHNPDLMMYGDCLRACVASIFELPAIAVPHFANECLHADGEDPEVGCDRLLREFLALRNLVPMHFRVPMEDYEQACTDFVESGMSAHHLLGGTSLGGFRHVVVGQYGRLVHDPWPDKADPHYGVILPDPEYDGLELTFFVLR